MSGTYRGTPKGGCWAAAPPQTPQHQNKKKIICRFDDIKHFTWFTLQPKWATEISWWLAHENFEKWIIRLENQECRTLSHGACSYICMYINTVPNSVMLQLYLRYDFCNTIFKIEHKLYIALRPPPPPPSPMKNFGFVPGCIYIYSLYIEAVQYNLCVDNWTL